MITKYHFKLIFNFYGIMFERKLTIFNGIFYGIMFERKLTITLSYIYIVSIYMYMCILSRSLKVSSNAVQGLQGKSKKRKKNLSQPETRAPSLLTNRSGKKVKSREKIRQVRENWSQQLEHKRVPKRDGARCPAI